MASFRTPGLSRAGLATAGARGVGQNFRVFGVEEAIAKLGVVNKIARIHLGYMVHASAENMAERARQNVPKITHNLEHGTKAEKGAGPYNWNVISSSMEGDVSGKNNYEYAGYVEYGTSNMEPRMYMTRAYNETLPEVMAALKIIGETLERL